MANFLGKKISLISKAGIRYEGILYTIDQIAFTVALSKVKSFGTEDRVPERYIAARDEVYEYIIFRGSDISDLHVCENSMYTDDSAIVKIMSPNLTNPSSPPAQSSQHHAINIDLNTSETVTHHQEPLSPVTQPSMSISKRFMNFSKVNSRPDDRSHDNHPEHSNQRYNKSEYPYRESEDLDEVAVNDYRQFQNREQMVNKSDFFNSTNDENRRYTNYHHPTQRQRGSRGSMYTRGFSGGGGGGRPYRANKDNNAEVIKDDFDFESANALMAAELAHMHVGAQNGARDDPEGDNVEEEDDEPPGEECEVEKPFYDKSKSFFDNISSEVTERFTGTNSDRRPRNNIETFGASEYGRGGGGMNHRGGGGYRGGGNSRWSGGASRGAFRGAGGDSGYNRGSSAGFIRRGSSYGGGGGGGRGADTRFNRAPFSSNNSGQPSTQRRPFISGFGESSY